MAPAIVLWAWWRRGGRSADRRGVASACAWVIVATYALQLLGLAAGLIAARGYADPLAHVTDFAALVAVIVAAEYAGHAAAAVLGVTLLPLRRTTKAVPCR